MQGLKLILKPLKRILNPKPGNFGRQAREVLLVQDVRREHRHLKGFVYLSMFVNLVNLRNTDNLIMFVNLRNTGN